MLLPRGRTAHSRFKIPIEISETSICSIRRGTMLADVIQKTSLIIWDEAPMTHRRCFEALDRTLRYLLSEEEPANAIRPFGGKVVVLGGDFRQILPVVQKGSKTTIIDASITNSILWPHITLLSRNDLMQIDKDELDRFAKWVLDIGNGTIPATVKNDESEPSWVQIPDDLLIKTDGEKIPALINEVFPDLLNNHRNPEYLSCRAIVCPNNATVDDINSYVVNMIPGKEKEYFSCDTICKSCEHIQDYDLLYPTEFLNSINVNNFPNHRLVLKKGVTVMLLRNLNQSMGLCNGTRLLVDVLG